MSNADQASIDFHAKYITSTDVRNQLMVSRTALHHRRKLGKLPGGIELNNNTVTLWERAQIRPYLEQWSVDMYGRVVEGV